MSVRPPSSALDRTASKRDTYLPSPLAAWLSSLSMGDSDRRNSSGHQRESLSDCATENTGLVQRCVIVQRDQLGFGFTVCGERIKLVQNVRPGGAAVKAGVQEGDRIIKVNGSLVSSMSHQEVVKLIKSGTYVALTLQGPTPSNASLPLQPLPTDTSPNHRAAPGGVAPPPPLPPAPASVSLTSSQRITGPRPLQDPEVQKHATQILKKMLQQEEAELQALLEEQSRNPSPSLEERIESAQRRAHQVRVKIQQDLEGTRSWSESGASYLRAGEGRLSMDSQDGDFEGFESPRSSPSLSARASQHRRQGSETIFMSDQGSRPQIIGPEEEEDDEDSQTQNEMDGPFQDIELLKSRPAHMTVFMRYIFSQLLDPNPLLFYLSVEAYLSASPKDARHMASQIYANFLDKEAPLKIRVSDDFMADIDGRLHAQEDIRGPLSDMQLQVLPEIQEQIQDYRNKQMIGLGSLFGEGDLQLLDGDPAKEKQIVDRQVTALWEILSKHEEDRSAPIASAILLYLRHAGIKLRDSRVFSMLDKSQEKDKWLPFFPKTKKPNTTKKEREKEKDAEEKKRNPILKYIAKPRSTSQSIRPGSVRNIIQQFENNQHEGLEPGTQRLSTGSLTEELLEVESPGGGGVKLARSESLKAQGEVRKPRVEVVPRSRSDVDMDDAAEEREREGARLHQSASSSASSLSARSLENPTPPYTPRSRRKSMDSPVTLFPENLLPNLPEDDPETQNWQQTVGPDVLSTLEPREIDRQAVIYELFTTESSHLRTLRVLDQVFLQKMKGVLNQEELGCIFPNLPEVLEAHSSLCESMKKLRESLIVNTIGDIMLARFEGPAGQEFQEKVSQFCSRQAQALELIKSKQQKDPRFQQLIQECEANPQCRRLQLKDLLVSEMQRLTKYPLLLGNIIKYTDTSSSDLPSLQRAQDCCRGILKNVNEAVKETENRHRLCQYQRRLDLTVLERMTNPIAAQFRNLDLTTKRMIHEGPLTWRVSKDKALEIQALLLEDILVLLQRVDDRLILRCPSRNLGGGNNDVKMSFSPIVSLDSLLVRSVATDNKALYVISTSERQIYELVAGTSSEKNTWKDLLEKAIALASRSPGPAEQREAPVTSSSLDLDTAVSPGSGVYQSEDSLTESSASMETEPPEDEDDDVLTPTPPADPSVNGGDDISGPVAEILPPPAFERGIADAALDDVENLRLLIFRNIDDGWSQDSDDTPTNETANETPRGISPFQELAERGRGETGSHAPPVSNNQSELQETEIPSPQSQLPIKVVRKAEGAGTSSLPDDITDDVATDSSQSAKCSQAKEQRGRASVDGNMFYLVMPESLKESSTDDPHTDTESSRARNGESDTRAKQDVTSSQRGPSASAAPAAPALGTDRSQLRLFGQAQPPRAQRHVIRNVDEIFQAIEELTAKLHKLREIEVAHNQLLKGLSLQSANQERDHTQGESTVVRTRPFDRGAGDGKEGAPAELSQPEIQSTGF
ncbi:rho guanine nucleotide exchange factor 11 isoform X3 [Lepisosteus oculatus]|uniref:rho guanine nucleotide exchange factor 11 isoform X3 n=1 Tax=Lepisosteus oculatus TaxID=7918 RepID=UPI00371C421D